MTTPFNPANPTSYSSQNPVFNLNNTPIGSGNLPTPSTGTPPPQNNVVQTAGAATNQYNNLSGNLTNMLAGLNQQPGEEPRLNVNTYSDAYTQALDAQAQRGSAATKSLIASIQAQNQNMRNSIGAQYGDYKKGLQLLGIQQNSAQSSPDLLMGHIQQAQNEYTAKIQQLNAEESRAMMEAENARADKDLSTLKEKMDYIKQIQKEKDDALSRTYERMQLQTKIADTQASMYYDALQKLPDAQKEDFLIAVSQKYNIPLQALVKSISDVSASRNKGTKSSSGGGTGKKLTLSQIGTFKKNNPDVADQITFGMTDQEVNDIIYGGESGGGTSEFDRTYFEDNFSKGDLYKLALAVGVPRKKNLSKKDEINKFFDSEYFAYAQSLLEQGNTIEDIINANQ